MHFVKHPAFRWILSIILLALIAYQLWLRRDNFETLKIESWRYAGWYIILVILLMPLNWWLETLKWHGFLTVHAKVAFQKSFKAVTSGIALSLFTPNRIGEYGGRILFMPYAIRWPVFFSTFMGSISQNLVAFSAGVLAFVLLVDGFIQIKIIGSLIVLVSVISYFQVRRVILWICKLKMHNWLLKISNQLAYLKDYTTSLLIKSLLIALIRYGVYVFQFVLLLIAFEPDASVFSLFLGVSCLYLFHTIIPMPPVADVLARTNIALILWAGTGMSELSISLASFIVWVINLLIPAAAGSIALGTINLKKSFST